MNKEETICRLCLTIIDYECDIIEEVARHMISMLSLNMDLSATENPIICRNCAERLQQFFDFKTACLHTNDPLTATAIPEDPNIDYSVCCLCKKCEEKELFLSVRPFEKKTDLLREMLVKCMPELNFSFISIICRHCLDSLNGYFSFLMTCHSIEEKIKEYRKTEDAISNEQLKLHKIFQFSSNFKLNKIDQLNNETVTKKEENFFEDNDVMDSTIKNEYLVKEELDFDIKVDECEVETESNHNILPQPPEALKLKTPHTKSIYKCDLCLYGAKQKGHLTRHLLVHKDVSELTMYRCDICPFESKQKYQLKTHALTHKDFSEITAYQCELCPYKVRQKGYLNRHLLTHMDKGKITMYKCGKCTYESKYRANLKRHMTTHWWCKGGVDKSEGRY